MANEIMLDSVLPAGSIISYTDCKKRFAVDTEDMPIDSSTGKKSGVVERTSHPERYPEFHIDFAGITVRKALEMVLFDTAGIDKARKVFRERSIEAATAWRERWDFNDEGHPVVKIHHDEFVKMDLPKTPQEKIAEAEAILASLDPELVKELMAKHGK